MIKSTPVGRFLLTLLELPRRIAHTQKARGGGTPRAHWKTATEARLNCCSGAGLCVRSV